VITIALILIAAVIIPAFFYSRVSGFGEKTYGNFLVFAGAYLFSITIVHILPELFSGAGHESQIGLYVLAGFFFQQILEYFSTGIEHGHLHLHSHSKSGFRSMSLLLAMFIHAFLEGTLLSHPSTLGPQHSIHGLLLGIILHKIPASLALMALFMHMFNDRVKPWVYISVFSIASPLGLMAGDWILLSNDTYEGIFLILFAFVSGNFLHISTTIVFETSPEHKFNFSRFLIILLGAITAVVTEYII
jgi:zinc transporter ZupT